MSISKSQAQEIYRLTKQNSSKAITTNNPNIKLLVKFANKISEDDFVEMAVSGEVPAIRLTNSEMELLKGGAEGDGIVPRWISEAWSKFKEAVGLN